MSTGNKKNIDGLFAHFQDKWDEHEPEPGHQLRFLDRLQPDVKKKRTIGLWPVLSVAATVVVMLGLFFIYNPAAQNTDALAEMSPKARETQHYFASVIKKELAQIEKEKSPETQRIVKDALFRMEKLEKDYDKLTKDLLKDGENKQLLNAMIINLQTRVSFLQEVMAQIENTKKLKQQSDENTQL